MLSAIHLLLFFFCPWKNRYVMHYLCLCENHYSMEVKGSLKRAGISYQEGVSPYTFHFIWSGSSTILVTHWPRPSLIYFVFIWKSGSKHYTAMSFQIFVSYNSMLTRQWTMTIQGTCSWAQKIKLISIPGLQEIIISLLINLQIDAFFHLIYRMWKITIS